MGKTKKPIVIVLVLLVGLASYWAYGNYLKEKDLSFIEATGTVEATTVDLNAKMAGSIKTLSVDTGDTVEKGQLVAEILRNDLAAQRERDALTVEKAEAVLADLLSGARSQEKKEAVNNVNIAQTNYNKALSDYERIKALYEAGAISEVDYENAKVKKELTKNQLGATTAKLNLIESGTRPQQIEAAKAELQRSKAILKASEAVLDDLKIDSPVTGTVLTKNYEVGEYAQMGAPIVNVADLKDLWIKVYIPTDDLPYIKLGQKVSFSVSGIEKNFNGVVEEIAAKGEYTPKTIQTKKERTNVVFGVKIKIDNEEGTLKPGMPADVVFGQRDTND